MFYMDNNMAKQANRYQKVRYERKFIVPEQCRSSIYYLLAVHPALFSEIFCERQINNIYFDSINYKFYHENIAGIASRKKVRLRWYGNLYGKVNAQLEIKTKYGMTGSKETYCFPPFNFTDQTNILDIKALLLAADIPEHIRQELLTLELSLLNCYVRRYFLSFDQQFRVTIDSQLKYYRVDNNTNLSESFMTIDPDMILELKYDRENDSNADQISSFFPFRVARNSKYINGIQFIRI